MNSHLGMTVTANAVEYIRMSIKLSINELIFYRSPLLDDKPAIYIVVFDRNLPFGLDNRLR